MKLHSLMKELGSVTVLEHLHRCPIDITPMQQEAGCLMPMSILAGKETINFRGILGSQLDIIANKEGRKKTNCFGWAGVNSFRDISIFGCKQRGLGSY